MAPQASAERTHRLRGPRSQFDYNGGILGRQCALLPIKQNPPIRELSRIVLSEERRATFSSYQPSKPCLKHSVEDTWVPQFNIDCGRVLHARECQRNDVRLGAITPLYIRTLKGGTSNRTWLPVIGLPELSAKHAHCCTGFFPHTATLVTDCLSRYTGLRCHVATDALITAIDSWGPVHVPSGTPRYSR